jgi:hypothetical protein
MAMSQKQQYFDYVMIFIMITGGACLGGIAFGATYWIGKLVLLLMGTFIFSAGIYLAILQCVAKRHSEHVDNSEG